MKKILYIGEEASVIDKFGKLGDIEFRNVRNVIGLHNKLNTSDDLDMVLSEYNLKGSKGDGIFQRYKDFFMKHRIPFSLIDRNLDANRREEFLRMGIAEVYDSDIAGEVVAERIDFLKQMLDARLRVISRKIRKEYKIPAGKRVFDIVVAGIALLLLSPLLLLIILALKLESRGPVFYVSKRVGTGYKVFDFYKFRSMYIDADARLKDMKHLNQYSINEHEDKVQEEIKPLTGSPTLIYKDGTPMSEEEYLDYKRKQQAGTFVKIKDDPRVTRVGKFIRNTSIDELPQLINVLKGDMSIVGNRPLPLYEAEQLTSDDWGERFLAPAGITGLWQVEKRGKGSMSEEERKALDNKYAKNFSFWNDIKLILKTIPALFQKENV